MAAAVAEAWWKEREESSKRKERRRKEMYMGIASDRQTAAVVKLYRNPPTASGGKIGSVA